ncbi:hypothetical protein LWI28_019379 [Acer negundo]|uniref:Uncharacterized protein n=1 Tax=Acer negundo TaxID=4023 RepID=A0AAD5JDY0_ACENE|nr:hypothetical protein LWI28_019379 [Acer negundo]
MIDLRENDDSIFKSDWMLPFIARDLFLLENQLPFFLLSELFSKSTEIPDDHTKNLLNMILYFFNGILPGAVSTKVDEYPVEQIKHLVGFVHDIWLPSPAQMEAYRRIDINKNPWKFICCATEIKEAGIKFLKVESGSLFDIKFDYGVMRIPTLSIGDFTESVFRNLIAYEQFSHDRNPKHVIDYLTFMDCLINTPEDAELLRRHGIIDNWLGDDKVIANLINSLGDGVVLGENFYYSEVFNKVNLHCSRRFNKWKAKLRHDYFRTPWAIISFIAALVLLILTFLQTLGVIDEQGRLDPVCEQRLLNISKQVMANEIADPVLVLVEEKLRSLSRASYEFVEMMLLDGCFIVELIHKSKMAELREDDDPIFKLDWMLPYIARDMFLLENQLPFFVLWELFDMTTEIPDQRNTPFNMIPYFFNGIFNGTISTEVVEFPIDQIKHLVEFVHNIWLSSPARKEAYWINKKKSNWKFICCAKEIQEAGIKFLKVEGGSLFDIKFDYGVMRIPVLSIGDFSESVFRNLIAYEQFTHTNDRSPKYVIDYLTFMDCLINTPEDAELLRRHGIIDNWLGDDEVIANLINSLGDGVVLGENFYYSEVFNKVNLHCSRRCNKWKAKLRHDYFNTPWAIISFLAAVVLLIFTFLQTLFTILSYF